MKACCPYVKDITTHKKWSMVTIISVVVVVGFAVAAVILPINAYVVVPLRMKNTMVQYHRFHVLSQLSTDNSNSNSLVDTLSLTPVTQSSETTTTTIQVCGSKDCTRRGGGARLEKQLREVGYCGSCHDYCLTITDSSYFSPSN